MALGREQAFPITGFKGLDKSAPVPNDGFTRSLLNVQVRDRAVWGRGGVTFDSTFGAATSEATTNLMPYISTSLATTLLRIGATKVYKSTGPTSAWTDITGTALTGSSSLKPQWANYRGTLYFTDEGVDKVRSWTGSGNTAEIASGTPPLCKGIMSYYGYLFLLNIYDSSAAGFATRRAQYSNTPDSDWTACAANLLNFNETPGALLAGCPWGEAALMFKEDAVVILRWVGGQVRFTQKVLQGAKGTLAPLSVQPCGDKGIIYLTENYELHIADQSKAMPLPPNVNKILKENLYKANVANCRSMVCKDRQLYSLFFPLGNAANTARIDYNYHTGEFVYNTYPSHAWNAVQQVRWSATAEETPVGAVSTVAYTLDSAAILDNISASTTQSVSRYIDTDWIQYANSNEGRAVQTASQFTGATLVFEALPNTQCAVSVAVDHQQNFRFRKIYNLRAKRPGDEYVEVRYDLPPINCEWVNVRIEFLPNASATPKLRSGALHFIPKANHRDVRRSAATVGTM